MINRRKVLRSGSMLILLAATHGYGVSFARSKFLSNNTKKSNGMIRHNVYFWLKDTVTNSQKKEFEKGLKKFLSSVDEIESADIGIPAGTPDREVIDKSFGYSIFVSFKNVEDHNIYQEHPAHKVFIDDHSDLWADVKVYDSETI